VGTSRNADGMKYVLGPLIVDGERGAVMRNGVALSLAPKVAEALALLCAHAGEFVSKEEMVGAIWPGGYADDTTLWQKISLLRRFLRQQLGANVIETLPRRGYRLTVAVGSVTPSAHAPRRSRRWLHIAGAAATALVLLLASGAWMATRVHTSAALPPDAQRAYNLGQYFLSMRTNDSLRKAVLEFRAVIHARPTSALGYAGLAVSEEMLNEPAARQDAHTAVQLEPNSAVAQTSLAMTLQDRTAFMRAIALDPQYAPARLFYGEYLYLHGDVAGAYTQVARAIDLDPSLAIANVWLARLDYLRDDAPSAVTYASRALTFATSDEEDALLVLGLSFEREHRYGAALTAFAKLAHYTPRVAAAATAALEAQRGERRRALADLQHARALPGCECAKYWIEVALAERALGEPGIAAQTFERAAKAEPAMNFDPRVERST
jgi:DNA-binding winged helix-turn-helix (wHTH) protein